MTDKTFIETQFPVSKLSKESYKERKANYSQTLTGLGKWWGRKPLIMIRAVILGLLMPASNDPKKDRDIYLKILTMDEEGLWQRKSKAIPLREVYNHLTADERCRWFKADSDSQNPKYQPGLTREDKQTLQRLVFNRLSYDEKLVYCDRPEQVVGPSEAAWTEINTHLGTQASSLPELVQQLGKRRFGHIPRVGDAFCGGGSVPFEAARIGCEAYGSDLNPVAALLTWGALNIVGGGEKVAKQVREAQEAVFQEVDRQITEWGIEHNEQGWRADAFLYCTETQCPECSWRVPLAPSWVIGEKTHTIARLVPDPDKQRFEIEIRQGVSKQELADARKAGTVQKSRLVCPHCGNSTPMGVIRGDRRGTYGLRQWENEDLVPRPEDVFQERLYCIRWVKNPPFPPLQKGGNKVGISRRHYRAPTEADLKREEKVLALLKERFGEWQEKGYIPSRRIEPGDETTRLMRERGWTHWHHLFTPRQLLVMGLLGKTSSQICTSPEERTATLLSLGKSLNYTSRLSMWHPQAANEKVDRVFVNQALNTYTRYGERSLEAGFESFVPGWEGVCCNSEALVEARDAREINWRSDVWVTDPPYADAINYHELSEFFLAWYEKHLPKLFPEWYTDSKRALAICGSGKDFRQSMVDSYRNLADHMPDNGLQVVMFTHQDAGVWADLALILWAAGLRVTAAWTIATETESALKEGNYVQGTVLMVLRKQTSDDIAFLDEIVPQVEIEVKNQLRSMLALDDKEDPNFSDADYQLAAYAAALRVLTQYQGIEDIDVGYELSRERRPGETSPIEKIIEDAVKTASNFLVPSGLSSHLWKRLTPQEKFYLKGLEVESHGDFRSGVFQEFARGLGVREYKYMLQSGKANQTRLRTASEFKRRELGTSPPLTKGGPRGDFGTTLLRNLLFAVYRVAESEETREGMTWLKTELPDYWAQRENILTLARYLGNLPMEHWEKDAAAARLLAGAVENDHV